MAEQLWFLVNLYANINLVLVLVFGTVSLSQTNEIDVSLK